MKGTRAIAQAVLLTLVAVGQIALSILLYNTNGSTLLTNSGWAILWVSALFGWLPIFTFKKWGGVSKGKSYMNTTVLVDRGVYAIVRHPQYLAGVLIAIGLTLIAQHWLVAVLGIIAAAIYYMDTFQEEASALDKFGDSYRQYMENVPRLNFILGFIRLLQRRK